MSCAATAARYDADGLLAGAPQVLVGDGDQRAGGRHHGLQVLAGWVRRSGLPEVRLSGRHGTGAPRADVAAPDLEPSPPGGGDAPVNGRAG